MFSLLLAEVIPPNVADVMPGLSSLSSIGFAIWFAYYTTTTTLPKQLERYQAQLDKMADTHAQTIREMIAEMKADRDAYDRWRMGPH